MNLRRYARWLALWGLPAVLGLAGCGDDSGGSGFNLSNQAELRVPEEVVFPRVAMGETATQTIRLRNTGTSALSIRSVDLKETDGDDNAEFEKGEDWFESGQIEPSESASLQVAYSPTNLGKSTARLKIRSNSRSANSNGYNNIRIRALEIAPQISSRKSVTFGRVEPGESETRTLEIKNVGFAPLKLEDLFMKKQGGDDFEITYPDPEAGDDAGPQSDLDELPISKLGVQQKLAVRIWFEPDTLEATQNTLIVTSNAENQGEYSVSLRGNSAGPCINVVSYSERIEFEATEVGQTKNKTITVENCSADSDLKISSIAVTNEDRTAFTIKEDSLPGQLPGGSAKISVDQKAHFILRFRPRAAREYAGKLLIKSNDAARQRLQLELAGEGKKPEDSDYPESEQTFEPVPNSEITDVRPGHTEGDDVIYFMAEKQDFVPDRPIRLESTRTESEATPNDGTAQVIESRRINSYYVHYDQVGDSKTDRAQDVGALVFENEIIGVILTEKGLDASNVPASGCQVNWYGNAKKCESEDAIYPVTKQEYGPFGTEYQEPNEKVIIKENRTKLWVSLDTGANADNMRVITAAD